MKPIALTERVRGGEIRRGWAFRRFDGAETAVVRVVNVTSKPARSTSRPPGPSADTRHCASSCLRQQVGLVRELRQLVRAEEQS
jgi:hypothetical protein